LSVVPLGATTPYKKYSFKHCPFKNSAPLII